MARMEVEKEEGSGLGLEMQEVSATKYDAFDPCDANFRLEAPVYDDHRR
jgi:hypothetical protein